MTLAKILVVDDNDAVREMTQEMLENRGFEVVPVASVHEALRQIVVQQFDVLVTDLHMPSPGDGFAVVTAMRHAQPKALTIVVSGYPDTEGAMAAIVLQADQIMTKPVEFKDLANLIKERLAGPRPATQPNMRQTVASILEREASGTIQRWLSRVEKISALTNIRLSTADRTSHLPEILKNIITRLRETRDLETPAKSSPEAVNHGVVRFFQGYSAPLIVQESRLLQVSIFETIQRNLVNVDFSCILPDVMLIADEVDAQLTQCIDGFLTTGAEKLAQEA